MYTPENHTQMFEILAALRTYAGTNGMTALAEMLDDALVVLAAEVAPRAAPSRALGPRTRDRR